MTHWTIIVGIDLAPWNVLDALQQRAGELPHLLVLFPERFLHPSLVCSSVLPRLRRLAAEGPITVVTHSQTVLTAVGSAVATGDIACRDVTIVRLEHHVSELNVERWIETMHTLDGNGSLSAGWPIGYLEP